MALDGNKCVICRKFYYVNASTLKTINQSSENVFSCWKSECATALCHVLFDKHLKCFVNYFQNTHYCSECEQLVRDISFTWKQFQLFQNRLKELSRVMSQMLELNFQLIEKISEPLIVEQRISYLLNSSNLLKTPNYSYDEMVEVIYSVMSSELGLSRYLKAKEVADLNSSLSNDLKTDQISATTFGEDFFPSTFGDNDKIKKELLDQEDQASYSQYYNENDDQPEVKPEKFASCVYENREPIRSNEVENILNDVKYDGESSNSSDQNAILIKKVERTIRLPRLKRRMKLKKIKNLRTNKMYYCSEEDCHKRFASQITRQIHVQKVHRGDSKPYKCTQCLRRFTSSEHMKRHEKNVHEKGRVVKTNSCRFCGSKFIKPDDLTSHCSQFHKPPNPFGCGFCTEVYQNSNDLTKHTKKCHPQPNVCGICEKLFINDYTLNRHHLKNHNDKNPWLQCSICDRKFAMQSWLNVHMEGHNESKLFKCDICGHQFKYSQQLKPHIKTMHENGRFECSVCGTILTTLYDLKTHRLTHQINTEKRKLKQNKPQKHTKQKQSKQPKQRKQRKKREQTTNSETKKLPNEIPYSCKFCGKGYINEEELQDHYSIAHQDTNPFKCAFCPLIFNSTLILSRHRQTTHPDPHELKGRLKCKSCDLYFANKSSLSFHSKRHIDPTLLLKCHLCSAVFRKGHALDKHLEFHNDQTKYVCETCGKSCRGPHALHNHSLIHLKVTPGQNAKEIILDKEDVTQNNFSYDYECKFCGKGYITEEELNSHYAESHQGPNPFTCAFCSAIYSNSVDLSQHQKSAHADAKSLVRMLKCESCDRCFSNKNSLYVHTKSHRDPSLSFKCHLCPATFKFNCYLQYHLASHSKEKKYVCEVCGKAYNLEATLRQHSRTHDESNRKYQCSICDKKFFKTVHCKNHELTHTNMKEFVCQICGKSFNRDCNLNEHLKIHAGEPTRRPTKKKSCLNPQDQDNNI